MQGSLCESENIMNESIDNPDALYKRVWVQCCA